MTDVAMEGTSGYERRENDFYSTPAWCTEALCDAVDLSVSIWEPAAGAGAISRVLEKRGHSVGESDILDFIPSNFLHNITQTYCDIVTNPPYSHAEQFIRHALRVTKKSERKVAMLLRNEYDCAKSRVDLFNQPPFAKKLVLTKRPKWIEGPLKASPRHNFAWYIWDWKHTGPATILYGP